MAVGVKQSKKKPKTPGRDYGVAPIGAAASRIDAEAGIGSFNPFNQPFNNPNMYNAAVPMIQRSAGNPQLGMYAMPPMLAPQEQPADPLLEELARSQAMSVMGMATNDGSSDGIAQINMPTEPLSNPDGTTDQAAAIRRAMAMRANPDYQRYLEAAKANQNFDFALPPMQTTMPATGGISAKEFRGRVGAQATKNQAARAADPRRMAVTERAKARYGKERIGAQGIGADAIIAEGLNRGNKELAMFGMAMKQQELQGDQQAKENDLAKRRVGVDEKNAATQEMRYKAEVDAVAPAKPGTAAFNAGAQQKAAPFRNKRPADVYAEAGPILDSIPTDPTEAANYAGGAGLAPDVLQNLVKHKPAIGAPKLGPFGMPMIDPEAVMRGIGMGAMTGGSSYFFDPAASSSTRQLLRLLFGESPEDEATRLRRQAAAQSLLGAGQAAR